MQKPEHAIERDYSTAIAIAGFDPSSGAGCTADLMVFAAHGIFATTAITALTVQSTRGIFSVEPTRTELLQQMLACLEEDLPPAAVKIGMLATAAHVRTVATYLREARSRRPRIVVLDPVLRSSSGTMLLEPDGMRALRDELLPLVDAITPNLREAEVLAEEPCATPAQMELCAAALHARYPQLRVIVTGGHLQLPADLLLDGGDLHWFQGKRIATRSTHGTGCAFSTALLAGRMLGYDWVMATVRAKAYVANAMRTAVPRGKGYGPMALLPMLSSKRVRGISLK